MSWLTLANHILIRDFYDPVWPNLAASGLCAIATVKRVKAHLAKHRRWQSKHFAALHTKVNAIHSATTVASSSAAPATEKPASYLGGVTNRGE